jgi:hypothetical protein
MLGGGEAIFRYLSHISRFLGIENVNGLNVISNLNEMKHGSSTNLMKTRILQHIKLQFVPQREHNLR